MKQNRSGRAAGTAALEEKKGPVIARVLSEVQRAVQNAQIRTAGSDFPQLDAVTLTLQTVIVKAGGFKIRFLVFSFGKTWDQERSHEMVLTLKPTKPAGASVRTLADGLEDAIVDAAEGVKDALTGTPPLSLQTFKASVSFVVIDDASGGADFTIEPITIELKGNLKNKAIHKIDLSFKR
jgi:NTP-dependent ternary system trypsin peptidase co-occuring protein